MSMPNESKMSNASTPFVPAPLSRTMTITSDPVVLSYYAQKAEEFNAQIHEPVEPVAVLLSEAEQGEKNQAMRAIFQKLRHTPAILPKAPSMPAVLSRTDSVQTYEEPSAGGLRRTDFDGLVYEPGTTALMPPFSGLTRAPSAMPSAMPSFSGLSRTLTSGAGLSRTLTSGASSLPVSEESID